MSNSFTMHNKPSLSVSNYINNLTTGISEDSSHLIKYSRSRTRTELGRLTYATTDNIECRESILNEESDSMCIDDIECFDSAEECKTPPIFSSKDALMPNNHNFDRSDCDVNPDDDLRFMTPLGLICKEDLDVNTKQSLAQYYKDRPNIYQGQVASHQNKDALLFPGFIRKQNKMSRTWVLIADSLKQT